LDAYAVDAWGFLGIDVAGDTSDAQWSIQWLKRPLFRFGAGAQGDWTKFNLNQCCKVTRADFSRR
jgi:hypothetical protein